MMRVTGGCDERPPHPAFGARLKGCDESGRKAGIARVSHFFFPLAPNLSPPSRPLPFLATLSNRAPSPPAAFCGGRRWRSRMRGQNTPATTPPVRSERLRSERIVRVRLPFHVAASPLGRDPLRAPCEWRDPWRDSVVWAERDIVRAGVLQERGDVSHASKGCARIQRLSPRCEQCHHRNHAPRGSGQCCRRD